MKRVALVLKKFRRFMRHLDSLGAPEARQAFLALALTKEEFVACGGHKTVSDKKFTFSFYRQLVQAKRDMEDIMKKGRFNKSKDLPPSGTISSEEGEESGEEVDYADTPKGKTPAAALSPTDSDEDDARDDDEDDARDDDGDDARDDDGDDARDDDDESEDGEMVD